MYATDINADFRPIIISYAGARTDIRNKDGRTAYELAKDPESAALLKRAGK